MSQKILRGWEFIHVNEYPRISIRGQKKVDRAWDKLVAPRRKAKATPPQTNG